MTKHAKVVARIRARPPEADFDDVRTLLRINDWTEDRQEGSHVTFVKPGELPLTIPTIKGRKVKRFYLRVLCERLGLDDR